MALVWNEQVNACGGGGVCSRENSGTGRWHGHGVKWWWGGMGSRHVWWEGHAKVGMLAMSRGGTQGGPLSSSTWAGNNGRQ